MMAENQVPTLAKLTIQGYTDGDRENGERTMEVQYNPEKLTVHHESKYHGTESKQARFSYNRSRSLTLDLVFDGTGMDRDPKTVSDRVAELLDVCYARKGEIHEPLYLKLLWGKEGVLDIDFHCRLLSANVTYTLFDRDGSPLRATIAATFVEDLSPSRKASKDRDASPDVTHHRVVEAGDTLTLLCREIYGSAEHYLRVAEVNGLDDVRELPLGRALYFPPFARGGTR